MSKQEIFFEDDPVMGTYPEYGGRTKMLNFFKSHVAVDIVMFCSNDKVGNRENHKEAWKFVKEHQDYQFYTLVYVNGWYGSQVMDRGNHICNSAYKYIAVRDKRYRVMRYKFNGQ